MLQLIEVGLLLGLGIELGRHGVKGSWLLLVAAYRKVFSKS